MFHVNESCLRREWVEMFRISCVTHMHESCPRWISHAYEEVISHTYKSHVTNMNKSSHVTHMHESCRTNEWGMSHIWMSLTLTSESWPTWISHVTQINEPCHKPDAWVMSPWPLEHTYPIPTHSHVWYDLFIWDMTHSYVWHASFVTSQLVHVWAMTWLIHMREITYSHVWYEPFINATWLACSWGCRCW